MSTQWISTNGPLTGIEILHLAHMDDARSMRRLREAGFRTTERIGYYLENIFHLDRDIVLQVLRRKLAAKPKFQNLKVDRITAVPHAKWVMKAFCRCDELRLNDILPLNVIWSVSSPTEMKVERVIVATAQPVLGNDPDDSYHLCVRLIMDTMLSGMFCDVRSANYEYIVCPQADIREEYEKLYPLPTHCDP